MAKFTVSEYLKRLTCNIWTRRYEVVLMSIRVFLFITFFAVVVATLGECQPFSRYWQVTPDPGPRCRSGYAQLLVMSCCDIVTDILLVVFPIPIIVRSAMPARRKFSISFLFSLSILLIVITSYRMPTIIHHHGRQQLRTLWASLEILAAAAVSNALILGSFVRDRGVKKAKYKGPEATLTERTGSDVTNDAHSHVVRSMTRRHWGNDSDEDLFANCRGRLGSVAEHPCEPVPAPVIAKPALPSTASHGMYTKTAPDRMRMGSVASQGVGDMSMSATLFDVGGILGDDAKDSFSNPGSSHAESTAPLSPATARDIPRSTPFENTRAFDFADVGGLLGGRSDEQASAGAPEAASTEEEATKRAGKRRKSNFVLPFTSASKQQRDPVPAPYSARSEPAAKDSSSALDPGDAGRLLSPSDPNLIATIKSEPTQHESQEMQLADAGGLLSPAPPVAHPMRPTMSEPTQHESQEMHLSDAGGLVGPVKPSNAPPPPPPPPPPPLKDDRPSRKLFTQHSSASTSPARVSRSRSSSLRPASMMPSPGSHHRGKSRSRSRDVTTREPHKDATPREATIVESLPASPAVGSPAEPDAPDPPTRPDTAAAAGDENTHPDVPSPDPPDADDAIDTREHARVWLAKIKEARSRQNENHGLTRVQAQAKGGEGRDMELADVGGLLGVEFDAGDDGFGGGARLSGEGLTD